MKKTTVTVAISAYNEEQNILAFLNSILKQKEEGFKLEKVLIFSDGSTDKTAEMANSLHSEKVLVIEDTNRIGKSSRLNQIYHALNSDILVQSDADVVFSHDLVIADLIKPLLNNKDVAMTGGNPYPLPGKTFVGKAVNCTFDAYVGLRQSVRGGNNVFSVDGRLLAYKKELVKKIHVPSDMIANDAYTYFCCLTNGYKYKFVKSSVVLFTSPQTLKDQIRQNTRFLAAEVRMSKYFPKNIVRRESYIPRRLLINNMLKVFIKHPVMSTYIVVINRYCQLRALAKEHSITALWDMANTTKQVIKIRKNV